MASICMDEQGSIGLALVAWMLHSLMLGSMLERAGKWLVQATSIKHGLLDCSVYRQVESKLEQAVLWDERAHTSKLLKDIATYAQTNCSVFGQLK